MTNEKPKAKNVAYEKIKKMIMENEVAPGELLSENALAKVLGISRTPIREAIFMLEAEGFISTVPNKGSMVVKFDMNDIVEFMQIREGLEGIAVRIAIPKADKGMFLDMLQKLESITDMEDTIEMEKGLQVGRDLHKLILETAGNYKLIRIVDNLNAQLDRIMILSRSGEKRIQTSHAEHIEITKAILAKDLDLAEKGIRNHIIGATNDAIKVFHQSYH